MKQPRDTKKKWARGALILVAITACDSSAPTGEPKDDSGGNQDIIEALAALPEVEVLQYSPDGAIPQFVRGELGKIDLLQPAGMIANDSALRAALPPILKVFRLENKDLELRKVNVDELHTSCEEAPMGGGQLFRATALLRVPAEIAVEELRATLEALADDLMVELSLDAVTDARTR